MIGGGFDLFEGLEDLLLVFPGEDQVGAGHPDFQPTPVRLLFGVEADLQILSAERVPNTDKLLKMTVDIGGEERPLVAGIAQSYETDALVGKSIIVVANLQPARIRGVESRGMLLAADLGGRPIIATFEEEVPPGTKVR